MTINAILTREEIVRAERFAFQYLRDRFINGRLAMRNILGGYLGVPAHDVKIGYSLHGKPNIAKTERGGGLGFNLTHSEHLALFAVSGSAEIGIDLEILRMPNDLPGLARSVFSEAENADFQTLSDSGRLAAFFLLVGRKKKLC